MRLLPFLGLTGLAGLTLTYALHLPTPGDAFTFAGSLLGDSAAAAAESAENVLTPGNEMRLESVGESVTVTSALFPKHKVRIKSTDGWCDPHTRSYSGYLSVNHGREMWFTFFESRNDPKNDPVVMWINGGPGCSSAMGLFMELGPCTIAEHPESVNDTKPNPHSWNANANVFFLDEPVNVGFSYGRHGQIVGTAEEAAGDVAAFVSIFFDTFKEFAGRAFHMAGESYGGRYLPVFASAVYDNNAALIKAGKEPVNLQSVMIGNGVTDLFATTESYYAFQCTKHVDLNRTISSIGACVGMAEAWPRCKSMAKRSCLDSADPTSCAIAMGYCEQVLVNPFFAAGLNPYDVSKSCTLEELSDGLCYGEKMKSMGTYLNLPSTRAMLGVDAAKPKWEGCNATVGEAFVASGDDVGKTWLYVTQLLERGVYVLNYVGTLDWICNYIGNEMWMESLQWSGQDAYNAAKKHTWVVDGKTGGEYKTAGKLTFLKVFGAGHMVPMDQPERASALLADWLTTGTIGNK